MPKPTRTCVVFGSNEVTWALHHRLLYDTGSLYAPGANSATRGILPYLRGRGIGRLDALVI